MSAVFMELVQLHERMWGMEQYPQRPSLANLIGAPIVAMWVSGERRAADVKRATSATPERFMLTCHQTFEELDALVTSVVVSGSASFAAYWKLSRLYVNQKPVKVVVQVQVIDELG